MLRLMMMVAIVLGFVGCGARESASHVQGIVTDLDGVDTTGVIRAYFIDGRNIEQSECLPDRAVIRRNCFLNIKRMRYTTFKRELDAGLAKSVEDLEEKVVELTDQVSRIHSRIGDTLELLAEREREEGGLSEGVQRARQEIAQFEADLAGYRDELRMVDERLAEMDNVSLRAQRVEMADEMQGMQEQLETIGRNLPNMEQRLSEIGLQIALLREEVGPAHSELQQLNRELEVTTADLAILKNDLRNYDETIDWLEASFTTRILSDQSERFSETRPFVRRFKAIFDSND